MMDGLGLAETTPGPLIMVLQFVGFIGAWHNPGGLSPIVAGTLPGPFTLLMKPKSRREINDTKLIRC
jgi:chromate transporter